MERDGPDPIPTLWSKRKPGILTLPHPLNPPKPSDETRNCRLPAISSVRLALIDLKVPKISESISQKSSSSRRRAFFHEQEIRQIFPGVCKHGGHRHKFAENPLMEARNLWMKTKQPCALKPSEDSASRFPWRSSHANGLPCCNCRNATSPQDPERQDNIYRWGIL